MKKILFGEASIAEYLKVTIPGEVTEKVYLDHGERLLDVSANHWLLCIDPVIFGVWVNRDLAPSIKNEGRFNLFFNCKIADNYVKISSAVLSLTLFDSIEEETGVLLLLRVEKSAINHLNVANRRLLFSRYYKKNGLSYSRFKSFVGAYSYPRQIRLVSFRDDNYYNIFPMDLLGAVEPGNRFVFGLRHTNLALSKIIQARKIVVSDVPFQFKDLVYQLGKHHSSMPPPRHLLPFPTVTSKSFEFYIPGWAENYQEVKILKTKNLGSHMLMWGEPQGKTTLNPPSGRLFLIHFLHYLWQKKRGLTYSVV